MILLDAQAVIAVLVDEPAADEVRKLISDREAAITVTNLAEVVDKGVRAYGLGQDDVARTLPMLLSSLAVKPLDASTAWRAGELRARHYHRSRSPLSLADCVLLAAAGEGDDVATSDPALLVAARAEGISVIPLPDSRGARPE